MSADIFRVYVCPHRNLFSWNCLSELFFPGSFLTSASTNYLFHSFHLHQLAPCIFIGLDARSRHTTQTHDAAARRISHFACVVVVCILRRLHNVRHVAVCRRYFVARRVSRVFCLVRRCVVALLRCCVVASLRRCVVVVCRRRQRFRC